MAQDSHGLQTHHLEQPARRDLCSCGLLFRSLSLKQAPEILFLRKGLFHYTGWLGGIPLLD